MTVTTRVLFAQAFDRLLPVSVAKIGDRNHAPNVAIGLVLVIGIGFCFLTSLVNLGSIVALQSSVLRADPAGRAWRRRAVPARCAAST